MFYYGKPSWKNNCIHASSGSYYLIRSQKTDEGD